jgi:two-component system LytT family response regulator
VQVADIDWIGAEGPYVRLHTATGTHLIRDSLKRLETVLDPDQFARIHRSTTVNLDRIATLHPHFHGNYRVVLTTGATLKLSRRYRDQLKHRLQL